MTGLINMPYLLPSERWRVCEKAALIVAVPLLISSLVIGILFGCYQCNVPNLTEIIKHLGLNNLKSLKGQVVGGSTITAAIASIGLLAFSENRRQDRIRYERDLMCTEIEFKPDTTISVPKATSLDNTLSSGLDNAEKSFRKAVQDYQEKHPKTYLFVRGNKIADHVACAMTIDQGNSKKLQFVTIPEGSYLGFVVRWKSQYRNKNHEMLQISDQQHQIKNQPVRDTGQISVITDDQSNRTAPVINHRINHRTAPVINHNVRVLSDKEE